MAPSTVRVVMGRPLARVCRSALYIQSMPCFPSCLPPSNKGRIDLHPSPERTLSCSMVGDLEPILSFYLSAPAVMQRLPCNPGFQGKQGDPLYLHDAFGAKVTVDGLWVNQRIFRRNVPGGCPVWARKPPRSFVT